MNTKLWLIFEEEELLVDALLDPLEELLGRKSVQGTTICLPPEEELLEPNLLDEELELDDGSEALLELLGEELELPLLLEPPVSDKTAKSTRADMGLIITSLMVPSVSPEVDFTSALVS